jgi:hypothetical protein
MASRAASEGEAASRRQRTPFCALRDFRGQVRRHVSELAGRDTVDHL